MKHKDWQGHFHGQEHGPHHFPRGCVVWFGRSGSSTSAVLLLGGTAPQPPLLLAQLPPAAGSVGSLQSAASADWPWLAPHYASNCSNSSLSPCRRHRICSNYPEQLDESKWKLTVSTTHRLKPIWPKCELCLGEEHWPSPSDMSTPKLVDMYIIQNLQQQCWWKYMLSSRKGDWITWGGMLKTCSFPAILVRLLSGLWFVHPLHLS